MKSFAPLRIMEEAERAFGLQTIYIHIERSEGMAQKVRFNLEKGQNSTSLRPVGANMTVFSV